MPRLQDLAVDQSIPERSFAPGNVALFLYNAIIWNAHRIHYDETYTTTVEHHPGVVIDGPLQGDWLTQIVLEWLGDAGELVEFEYSNRRASYIGARLTATGRIEAIDPANKLVTLALELRDDSGQVTTPGSALVRLYR